MYEWPRKDGNENWAAIEICTAADGKNLKSALNEFKIAWR